MTKEDKTWIYIGVGLAVTGGIVYWYKNKDNDKEQKSFDKPLNETDAIPSNATQPYVNTGVVTPRPKNNPKMPIVKSTNVGSPSFMYAKGQKIMVNNRAGLTAYDVQKAADGSFFTKSIKVKTFEHGELLGDIVGIKSNNGNLYYIVQGSSCFNSDSFDNRYYWVNHAFVKGIAPILKTTALINIPTLDTNKLLSKGTKGDEVKKLQQLLKIDADGDFGAKTETALKQKKGVTSITLASFK